MVTSETKARIVEIARGELLTESVWLRRLVAKALHERGGRLEESQLDRSHGLGIAAVLVHPLQDRNVLEIT